VIVSEFAERFRKALMGMDINEVAQAVGVSRSSFYKWLSGKFEPGLAKLAALSSIANVNLDWLITGRGEMRPNGPPGYIKPSYPRDRPPLVFERKWLETNFGPWAEGWLSLFLVKDDSMEPTSRKGDMLLAVKVDQQIWREAKNGVYLIARTRAEPGEKILTGEGFRDADLTKEIHGTFLFDAEGKLVDRLFARRVEFTAKPSAIVKCDNPAYPGVIETSPQNRKGIIIWERVIWHGHSI